MFSFPLPPEYAFLAFNGWVAVLYGMVYFWLLPSDDRLQMRQMSLCGAIGGVLISQLFRPTFWDPLSVWAIQLGPLYVTVEDALFGGLFAGIVSVLPQVLGWCLVDEGNEPSAQVKKEGRLLKVGALMVTLLTGFVWYWLLPLGIVTIASLTFLVGAGLICFDRSDLWRVTFLGGLVTLFVYGLLLTSFLSVVGNREDLALAMCRFYVTEGAFSTGVTLAFFSFAFGAFIVPLYAWGRNRHFVADTWHRP